MGWRFRRSIRIAPGIRLNVGRHGVTSLSLGGKGVTMNLSKRGTKTTYSLPGTGLSYQTRAMQLPAQKQPAAAPVRTSSVSPIQLRRGATYTGVGVAALLGFLALRPDPAPRQPVRQAATAEPSPASLPPAAPATPPTASLPSIIPPAMAESAAPPQGSPSPPTDGRQVVTTTGANVRSTPSTTGAVVKVLGAGTSLRIVATEGGWARVVGPDGVRLGWVHASLLR